MRLNMMLVVLTLSSSIFNNLFAQINQTALEIGDEVPDIEFKMLNHQSSTTKLSDYKGKVVILDFWATFCGPCIKKFPHLDSLQKENPDFVKIITIGRDNLKENPNKLNDFLQRYLKKYKDFKLPIAYDDQTALSYFPHQQISHFVWIDRNGKLVATTNGDEMSTEVIRKVYNGEEVDFIIKKDLMKFKKDLPLFANEENGGKERNVKYKSLITGYISGLPGSYHTDLDKNGLATKLYIRDMSLLNLFKQAYQCFLPNNQVVLEVRDKGKFVEDAADKNWLKNNSYSYELMTAPAKMEKLYKLLQHDLYAYFGIRAKVEKRIVKCLEFVDKGKKDRVKKKTVSEDNGRTIASVAQYLNSRGEVLAFDMTEDTNTLIEIPEENILKPQLLKKALNDQGFDIVETEKELDMFVISEVEE